MDDVKTQLEADYCPPLDSALFHAIISDFDLLDQSSLEAAKSTLDAIRSSAEEEAAADFDASGSAGADNFHESRRDGNSSDRASESVDTDLTSLSNGMGKLRASSQHSDSSTVQAGDIDLNALDEGTKASLLQELFPEVSGFTVSHTLKKCGCSWQRALDELLNISSFSQQQASDEEAIFAKGIDGFSEDQIARRGRRKKRKGKQSSDVFDRRANSLSSPDLDMPPPTNKWQTATRDIDFIASHAKLSETLVRSAYYANGASVPKTISHLLKDLTKSTSKITSADPTTQFNAVELGRDFPTIAPTYLTALIQLTHPSTSSAHQLAKALTAKPTSTSTGPIIPQYTPPSLSDDESSSLPSATLSTFSSTTTPTSIRDTAAAHRAAHHALSAQAAAAYRRSRSQPLMGGAAAYYADESRAAAARATSHSSAAADALVATQSSATQLDLHGVTVADAVRIARREVGGWWEGLGEARVNGRVGAGERGRGFRIVVGVGRHSEGGKGKIGPAVLKALANEGWRVEREEGVLVVKGKGRK